MKLILTLLALFIGQFSIAQNDTIEHYKLPELGDLNFPHGNFELQEAHKSDLQIIARHMLKHKELGILIIGQTDDTGPNRDNTIIGMLRANAIKDYLVGVGVEEFRISAASQGEDNRLFNDTTDFARAENRRVAMRFYYLIQ